jgi:hypothetical protein
MIRLAAHNGLSARQFALLALMGAVFWFVAALIVRWTVAGWVGNDALTALVFALVIPGTVPALIMGARVAGVGRDRLQAAAALMTGAAALLDGVALTWFPTLYGSDPAHWLGGAAVILWGAGVALMLGFVLERR